MAPGIGKVEGARCGEATEAPAAIGPLLVRKVIGRGSTGVVYEAHDPELDCAVAVKILECDPGGEKARADRCAAEARAMATLDHPNIVKILGIGVHCGSPCIEMELMRGGHVRAQIERRDRLDQETALRITLDAARALRAAHEAGIIHQDVKPANILLDENGAAKLSDFGEARSEIGGDSKIIGTPHYVAPEVVRQRPFDFRADIYSLGATLFHMLTGRPPFDSESISAVYVARLRRAAPDVREFDPLIHPEAARLTARMLEQDPGERHAGYAELIEAIEKAAAAVAGEAAGVTDRPLRRAAELMRRFNRA